MRMRGLEPNIASFTCIIKAFGEHRQLAKMYNWFYEMENFGVTIYSYYHVAYSF
jgi:pentatricopeptide repeat protein